MEEFAGAAFAAFEEACARRPVIEECFALAGSSVRVRLAGSALLAYALPPLAHRRAGFSSDRTVDLTICAFDSHSTGIAMPRPPWPPTAYTPSSGITGIEGDRFIAAFNVGTGVLDLLDLGRGAGLHWIADARRHPPFDLSSPFRLLFHWWMRRRGLQFMHGGAVGTKNGALLIVGKGGSGKSTVALACMSAGMRYLGDDYVLARAAPVPEVFGLYQTAKLNAEDIGGRFPDLATLVHAFTHPPNSGKAILLLGERFGAQLVERLPLRAIVVPKVSDCARPSLRPTTERASLTAVIPSTIRQLSAALPQDIAILQDLVRGLPAFELDLGADILPVPGLVAPLCGGE